MKTMVSVVVVLVAVLAGVLMTPMTAAAAPMTPEVAEAVVAVGELETKIAGLTERLTTLGRPLSALALVLVIITYIAEPVLPEVARENKGMIRKVLFAALALGIVPDLVDFFLS